MTTILEDAEAWLPNAGNVAKSRGRNLFARVQTDLIGPNNILTPESARRLRTYRVDKAPGTGPSQIRTGDMRRLMATVNRELFGDPGYWAFDGAYDAFADTGPDKTKILEQMYWVDAGMAAGVWSFGDDYYRKAKTFFPDFARAPGLAFTRADAAELVNPDGSVTAFAGGQPRKNRKGLLLGFGGTNYVRTFTDSPLGLCGVRQSGNANAVVRLVDDGPALKAARLNGLVRSNLVIEVDNSLGDTSAFVLFDCGGIIAGDPYAFRMYMRVLRTGMVGRVGIEDLPEDADAEVQVLTTTYTVAGGNIEAGGSNSRIYGKASAGSIVRFCLPLLMPGTIPPTTPIVIRNPGTFTGLPTANLAQTVLDPVDTTHLTKSGDAASVLSVVEDDAEISLRSIMSRKVTTRVYELDNTAGVAEALATADCLATVAATTYQVYTFMRVVGPGTAYVRFNGTDIASYGDSFWNLIGDSAVAAGTADKIRVRAPAGVKVRFVQMIVQAGASLPATLAPWALANAPTVNDDQLTLTLPADCSDCLIRWGDGLHTYVKATGGLGGTIDLGVSGKGPWLGYQIQNIIAIPTGVETPKYTRPWALAGWIATRRYSGTALDLDPYPTLAFADDFDANSLADSTAAHGAGIKWHGKGHTDFTDNNGVVQAHFTDITEAPLDTYYINAGSLRIRLQKVGGLWKCGCLSSINAAGDGFTFNRGYAEAKCKFPLGAGAWGAFWATNELPGVLLPHAEIDFIEAYGTNPENYHTTVHIWPSNHAHRLGPKRHKQASRAPKVTIIDGDWHLFGTEIRDDWVITYLDRVEVSRVPFYGEIDLAGLKLLLNLALLTTEIDTAVGPLDMYVDYVKVWTPAP